MIYNKKIKLVKTTNAEYDADVGAMVEKTDTLDIIANVSSCTIEKTMHLTNDIKSNVFTCRTQRLLKNTYDFAYIMDCNGDKKKYEIITIKNYNNKYSTIYIKEIKG